VKRRTQGLLIILTVVFIWSWPPLVIKHLSTVFDPFTQNFFRYSAVAAALAVISVIRRKPVFPSRANGPGILLVVFFMCVFQTSFAFSLYLIMPAQAALVAESSIIFSGVLSAILFADERSHILSARFIIGALVAVAGMGGFILAGAKLDWSMSSVKILGYQCAVAQALAWATYSVIAKKTFVHGDIVTSFSQVSILSAIVMGIMMLCLGRPSDIIRASVFNKSLVILSGLVFVGAANILYFGAIKRLGVAVCVTMTLLIPLFVAGLSGIIFGERFGFYQVLFGITILAGTAATIWPAANRKSLNKSA